MVLSQMRERLTGLLWVCDRAEGPGRAIVEIIIRTGQARATRRIAAGVDRTRAVAQPPPKNANEVDSDQMGGGGAPRRRAPAGRRAYAAEGIDREREGVRGARVPLDGGGRWRSPS